MTFNCSNEASRCILKKVREAFKAFKIIGHEIDAYIVHNNDPHMSEYLAECDARLKFVSGFSGSAGTAVITHDKALLWTDGRYYIQANKEISQDWTLMKSGLPTTLSEGEWLMENVAKGAKIGVDPRLISCNTWNTLQRDIQKGAFQLVPLKTNLIDLVWDNRPKMPQNTILPLDIKYTGMTSKDKVQYVRAKMEEKEADVYIVTALDDIAWLLNLRGSDIQYNPVFFSFLILTQQQIHLFLDEDKVDLSVRNHFNKEDIPVNLHAYDSVYSFISCMMGSDKNCEKVWIPTTSSYEIYSLVPEKRKVCEPSIIAVMKAIKTAEEVQGMIQAHIKDGVALCRYFAWLEKEVPSGNVTECSGSEKLDLFRRDDPDYVGPSFFTISSSGPNAAITHYRPSLSNDRPITTEEMYLCDSGGQYLCGTTDVTRTMHFGKPSDFEKECFTRVFKGQVSLGTTIFPNKVKGNTIDAFARRSLWEMGLDYGHGTGHGVGSYLYVHEGPMGISTLPFPDDPGLQVNMFVSNEPGYYEEGAFGIRLENIVQVVPATTPYNFQDRGFLTFNTITLCPIQTKILIPSVLTAEETRYLNEYHNKCLETLGPILKEKGFRDAYEWLVRETAPIG